MNSNFFHSQWLLEVAKSTVLSHYVGNSIHLNVYHFVSPPKKRIETINDQFTAFSSSPEKLCSTSKKVHFFRRNPEKKGREIAGNYEIPSNDLKIPSIEIQRGSERGILNSP
jgi:hypothetical protein